MRFRLPTLFWIFALLASAMATFGILGLLPFVITLIFWALVWKGMSPANWLVFFAIFGLLGFLSLSLGLSAISSARERARIVVCRYNLQAIAHALQEYHSAHGSFPLAHTPDANGNPMHSWRLQICPYLGNTSWYDKYDFEEPWDGPNNIQLANASLSCYECPSDPPVTKTAPHTNYFAVVSPRTAWPPDRPRKLSEITDGPSKTILLIDAAERSLKWTQPKDLAFEEALELLTSTSQSVHMVVSREGFFYKTAASSSVCNVVFADGSARSLRIPLPEELAIAMLTVDGGEKIDEADFDRVTQPQLDYRKIYAFSMFVLMVLLPLMKLRRNRSQQSKPLINTDPR